MAKTSPWVNVSWSVWRELCWGITRLVSMNQNRILSISCFKYIPQKLKVISACSDWLVGKWVATTIYLRVYNKTITHLSDVECGGYLPRRLAEQWIIVNYSNCLHWIIVAHFVIIFHVFLCYLPVNVSLLFKQILLLDEATASIDPETGKTWFAFRCFVPSLFFVNFHVAQSQCWSMLHVLHLTVMNFE